ncbi:MAG: hypothetical protein GX748_05685, partial [Lentisphaerae bacterium]|nr:hypothetical protein [Lentisphaerota bacterium]
TLTGGASGSVNKEDANNRGGGLYANSLSGWPILYDCIVSNNAAIRGGGAFAGTFHRCLVSQNAAKNNGGGVRETILHDSLIVYNTGGGVTHSYSNPLDRVSGVYNCTVALNAGPGLEQSSGYNTISVENTTAFQAGYPTVTHINCCFSSATTLGTNNIVASDVDFVDAENWDFRLMPSSPCLDIGDPALNGNAPPAGQRTDYFGAPRVQGAGLDLGAIEGAAENTATVTCIAPSGAGTLSPMGHVALYTLPTQLVFTAAADAGHALRHFTVNGARMMDCGNTFTMKVTRAEAHTVSAVFLPARYVDAEAGSDENDGATPETAWQTLQYAVDTAPVGSMVLAAPGFYNAGVRDGFGTITNLLNRVVITRNVVLKGSGAGHSFIMGASDPAGDAYGCGPNAVRCVLMSTGALEGFTVTGGRSSNLGTGNDWWNRGGGFVVSGFTAAQIWDCVISNNVATRGAAIYGGLYHRCRIVDNRATVYGVNRYGTCYDCLLARNVGGATGEGAKLYNCTVTANDNGIRHMTTSVRAHLYNSIIFGNTDVDVESGTATVVTNCCTGGGLSPGEGNIAADPLFVDAANGDYRLRADSPCRDTGDVIFTFEPEGTDFAGGPRVIGPQVNMGAFESCVGVINPVAAPGSALIPSGPLLFESFPTSVTFTVSSPPGRTFLYFSTNGIPVPYTGDTITLSVLSPETAILLQTHFEGTFYADPSRPDNSGDGGSWETAKRTLQAAVDLAFDGETVMAAPGVYNEGTRVTPPESAPQNYLPNRLVITNAITVRSRDGAAATTILGAFDTVSGDVYGRGPNAVRGVYMNKGVLQGFTITGGATGSEGFEDENNRGGGVYAPM